MITHDSCEIHLRKLSSLQAACNTLVAAYLGYALTWTCGSVTPLGDSAGVNWPNLCNHHVHGRYRALIYTYMHNANRNAVRAYTVFGWAKKAPRVINI